MRETRVRFPRRTPITLWSVQPMQQHSAKAGDDDDPKDDDDDPKDDDPDDDDDPKDGDDKGKPPAKSKADDGPDYKAIARDNDNKAKAADRRLNAVLKALGVDDKGDLTPEQLREKYDAQGNRVNELLTENAVIKATPAGVDVDVLLDSRKFTRDLADLDPSSDKFTRDVKKLVDAEVERRGLAPDDDDDKGKGKPRRSGGSVKGNDNEDKRQWTRADLKGKTPAQISKAQADGLLKDLMAGKT